MFFVKGRIKGGKHWPHKNGFKMLVKYKKIKMEKQKYAAPKRIQF